MQERVDEQIQDTVEWINGIMEDLSYTRRDCDAYQELLEEMDEACMRLSRLQVPDLTNRVSPYFCLDRVNRELERATA